MINQQLLKIMTEVANVAGLQLVDLFAVTRAKAVTTARAEYFYRALRETPASSVEIGKSCGRDHSTVLYGAAKHALKNGLPVPRGQSVNCATRYSEGRYVSVDYQ